MMKQTSSSIRKQLTSFDGERVVYSASNRHEKFMQRVEAGPILDMRHFNGDLIRAFGAWQKNLRK